jgi:hypothetical protein
LRGHGGGLIHGLQRAARGNRRSVGRRHRLERHGAGCNSFRVR